MKRMTEPGDAGSQGGGRGVAGKCQLGLPRWSFHNEFDPGELCSAWFTSDVFVKRCMVT